MIIILALFTLITPPGLSFEPGFSWFTLETQHFSIHFPGPGTLTQERLGYIRTVAEIAEEVRSTLTDNGITVPSQKVQIVIADYLDYYNGYATPFPDNTIVLLPFPPGPEKTNYDDWLRMLFLHEYSHIVQMDQRQGLPLMLARILGRAALPNGIMPAFLFEGYAVYNETRFSNFGRLRSADWQANIRNAVSANHRLSIDQCCGYELNRYPAGLAPYLYGSSFMQFWAKEKGDSILEMFNHQHSRQMPFFTDCAVRKVLGSGLAHLEQNWQNWMSRQMDSIEQIVRQDGLTNLKRMSYDGYFLSSPCWSRNGAEIYYLSTQGREGDCIKALNLGTMETRIIHAGAVFGSLAISPDGRFLAFAELQVKGRGYRQGDIFFYDLINGKLQQITFGERAQDPDFSPDGASLVYVSNNEGVSRLIMLNLQTKERWVLTEIGDFGYYHQPRFSPGGGLVAVGVWRQGGYADIELIDLKNGWLIPITQDRACDLFPAWSRTGKLLFFVSDRSGVYNLYAYSVESQKLFRCSNVLTGVYEPAVSPDNRKIALVALGADGYDINLIDLRPKDWCEAEEFVDHYPEMHPNPVAIQSEVYQYSPLPTVLPRFFLPWLCLGQLDNVKGKLEIGLWTLGWDVLQFHRYFTAAGYRLQEKSPFLNLTYELHRYQPVFQFSGRWTLKRQESRLAVDLPIYRTRNWQNLGFGTSFICDSSSRLLFDGSYRFTNSRTFRFSVAPVQGRSCGILFDAESKLLSSVRNRIRFAGYWNEYFGLPPQSWSLWARSAIGLAAGDSSRFSAFELSNQPGIFTVRGYSDSNPAGANILSTGLCFQAPLFWIERGLGTLPLFFSNFNGALYWDAGLITDKITSGSRQWRAGVGAELRTDFFLAHYLPFRFTAGAAIGFGKRVSHQIYLSLKSQLLESLFSQP